MLAVTAIFLAAAVVAVVLFKRLGLGSVLGYLAAGAAIGPSGLRLVRSVENTASLAELGVVFLLFVIGLELQPSRLWSMRSLVFGLGGAQVAVTSAVFTALGLALGLPVTAASVAGIGLAMSSTAFALQVLGEKNELASPHGTAAFGTLLFQDLAAIPVLAVVPQLAPESAGARSHAPIHGFTVVVALAAVVILGRYVMRPLFRFVASAQMVEVSTASALLVVLGAGFAMHSVGLSMSLGAFLAGVLLSDSPYRHEMEADIEPFKALLLGLFFMTVGMSARLAILVEQPLLVASLVLGVVAVKGVLLFALGRMFRLPGSAPLSFAVALAQGGEFAFVIFAVAGESCLPRQTAELLVVVVTLSMVLTPFLFKARDAYFARSGEGQGDRPYDLIEDEGNPVIVAGFGRFGQIVSRVLRTRGIRFTALEVNATQVDFVRRYGNKIYYGDASRPELLRAAGAARAKLFVLAIDDMEASLRTARAVQKSFPGLRILARARNRPHAYALLALGIETVVRETFWSSLDMARIALTEMGISEAVARRTVDRFAEHDEAQVRKVYVHRDNEEMLVAASKEYATELQRVFEQDAAESPGSPADSTNAAESS